MDLADLSWSTKPLVLTVTAPSGPQIVLPWRVASISLFAALLTTMLTLCASTGTAEACGVWSLEDVERGRVQFLVSNVRLGKRLIFTIWGARGARMRSVDTRGRQVVSPRGYKTAFDLRGGTLRYHGKRIGSFDGSVLIVGKRRFVIELSLLSRKCMDGAACWRVEVKHRKKTLARAKRAFSLACDGGRSDQARQRRDVARRVVLYLAWRSMHR